MEILFVLRKNIRHPQGKATVYVRLTVNGERSGDFSSFVRTLPGHWDSRAQLVTAGGEEAMADNGRLLSIRVALKECYNEMVREGRHVTAKGVRERFLSAGAVQPGLAALLDAYLAHNAANGLSKSTLKMHRVRHGNVTRFLEATGRTGITVADLCGGAYSGSDMCEELDRWLCRTHGHGRVHVVRQLRWLKSGLEWALRKRKVTANPFAGLSWDNAPSKPTPCLSALEVLAMEGYAFASPPLQRVADRFLMQCYTGLSYADLMDFRPDWDVVDKWIKKERLKTGVTAIVPMTAKLRALLGKHGGVVPPIANQPYNRMLKEVAALLGLDVNLTSRVARRTAGQLWVDVGMSIESVSRMLGHASIRTTQQSYVKVAETRIELDLRRAGLWEE